MLPMALDPSAAQAWVRISGRPRRSALQSLLDRVLGKSTEKESGIPKAYVRVDDEEVEGPTPRKRPPDEGGP